MIFNEHQTSEDRDFFPVAERETEMSCTETVSRISVKVFGTHMLVLVII